MTLIQYDRPKSSLQNLVNQVDNMHISINIAYLTPRGIKYETMPKVIINIYMEVVANAIKVLNFYIYNLVRKVFTSRVELSILSSLKILSSSFEMSQAEYSLPQALFMAQ